MKIENLISIIESEDNISISQSFTFANFVAISLRNNEEEGRKSIIYILNNWGKIPNETKQIWTDLIEQAGFYPYIEKENLELTSSSDKIRKESHLSSNIISKESEKYYFHEEQRYLKKVLEKNKNLIVSAPTSFGKSLLIEEIVASLKFKNIVVIQPTLALLDETRKKLNKYNDSYKIIVRTSQKPSDEKGNLFLLTAERVMEYENLPQIEFFVIDEFYKLSAKRDDERSDVLNNAFYRLIKQDIQPQFYLLGPNIDGISKGFEEKFNAKFYKTNYSLIENKTIDIYSMYKDKFDKPIKYKKFKEEKLFDLLFELKNEQTIIYCSSPTRVRELAQKFTDYLDDKKSILIEKLPLVEWIEKNINSNWNLINFLQHSIGVNDGALQKHINSSMIDYFNNKKLKYIFCTSTIIEGVNTSAKNVIFFDKTKGGDKVIDFFDYSNIRGRSGRMMIHYIGKIYDFNPQPPREKEMNIDIPFFEQNPVKKEIVNGMHEKDINDKTKNSKEYKELLKIPIEERKLFQKNGVLIDGQKNILEQLKIDIHKKRELIIWNSAPKYEQLTYALSLCWNNLLKDGETTRPMTLGNLIRVTHFYGIKKTIFWLINDKFNSYKSNRNWINENKEKIELILRGLRSKKLKNDYKKNDSDYQKYKYLKPLFNLSDNELLQKSVAEAFQILRHWFQYKVPKWLNVMNELQKYVCEKNNLKAGNYLHYSSQIENDFIRDNLTILSEYGIPTSAIRKIEKKIDSTLSEDIVIELSKNIVKNSDEFLEYEKNKILEL